MQLLKNYIRTVLLENVRLSKDSPEYASKFKSSIKELTSRYVFDKEYLNFMLTQVKSRDFSQSNKDIVVIDTVSGEKIEVPIRTNPLVDLYKNLYSKINSNMFGSSGIET